MVVQNAEQYEAVQANGWADLPDAHVEQPVEVRYVDAIAASAASEPAEDAPKKKGKKG